MKTEKSQGAKGAPRPELVPGLVLLVLAIALLVVIFVRKSTPSYLIRPALEIDAPLFLAAGAFLGNYFLALAKMRGARLHQRFIRKGARPLPEILELARSHFDRARIRVANTDWTGDWLPILVMTLSCAVALYLDYRSWILAPRNPSVVLDQWLFGGLIAACFPVLVLERRIATLPAPKILSGLSLSLLLRLLMLGLLLLGVSYLLRWLALPYWNVLEDTALLATGLVAAEILLRNAVYLFMPLPPLGQRTGRSESFAATLLQLKKPSLKAMSTSVSQQFGIDLGRSWALGFIRRASLPAVVTLMVASWLMTGITALDLSRRAVYESFGTPSAVFHSGLHLHLPWPMGRLKLLEYGTVREIPIVFPSESAAPSTTINLASEEAAAGIAQPPTRPTIEGPPPDSADRLWDTSHPSEASFLVASNRNGQETFEVVNIDIQILYRIGLSDQAALKAAYSVDNPEDLIRAAAGRMLARYFARYTIPDVLGQNRERFIRDFQHELQGRLDVLSAGLDILGVVIEAIHPPADAAAAYQDVQASGIRSQTAVATARGEAAAMVIHSQQQAVTMRNDATATGSEMINKAKADTSLFAGDVTAYHQDGQAFLLERRLSAIGKALQPTTPVTILDSHIAQAQMPYLDLRSSNSSSTPTFVPPPASNSGNGDN